MGGVAPSNDAPAFIIFGDSINHAPSYYEAKIAGLTFSTITRPYKLRGSFDTLHIGSGGITYSPGLSTLQSSIDDSVMLSASQTWNIVSGALAIQGSISDRYFNGEVWVSQTSTLTKTGNGTLFLNGNDSSNWTGGLVLSAGTFAVGNRSSTSPLGSGTITFNGGTLASLNGSGDGDENDLLILTNAIISNGQISTLAEDSQIQLGSSDRGGGELIPVPGATSQPVNLTLAANTTLTHRGQPLSLYHSIVESGGARSLTLNGTGRVVLFGENTYTGGTTVDNGQLIFANTGAVPTTGSLRANASGYIGFGDSSSLGSAQTNFISRFEAQNTSGTVGFDSDPDGTENVFVDTIDLNGFHADARLGSATRATLAATIIPQGTSYRFGGGGGTLTVTSDLGGSRSVVVDSPSHSPLTLRLTSTENEYSGGTTVTRSALIFGEGAQPGAVAGSVAPGAAATAAPSTFTVTAGAASYVGTESIDVHPFLATIATSSTGAIGFDYAPGANETRIVSNNLDLSNFTGPLFLATASQGFFDSETRDFLGAGLRLTGTITPAGGAGQPYRFAAYKGGALDVNSVLTGTAGVIIGDSQSLGTFGDLNAGEYSTVLLSGENSSLSGGVTLNAGRLAVSNNHSLGSGQLVVNPFSFADTNLTDSTPKPQLIALAEGVTVANPIQLNGGINLGGPSSLNLTGVISGSGGLDIEDFINVSLHGDNTFTGGIRADSDVILNLYHDRATGTGMVRFEGDASTEVKFRTSAPVIGGLESNNTVTLYAKAENTSLTVNQTTDAVFRGNFYANTESAALRFVKTGAATLYLESGSFNQAHGTTETSIDLGGGAHPEVILQVNQGKLIIGDSFSVAAANPYLWVNGGTLAITGGAQISNPVLVTNGGRLAGTGSVRSAIIGSGATLAAGDNQSGHLGTLTFTDHLTLAAGGVAEFHLFNLLNETEGYDRISVLSDNTLEVTASTADRFTIKLISLGATGSPGSFTNLDTGAGSYHLELFRSPNLEGFDPAKFVIDTSAFSSPYVSNTGFTLTAEGNSIMLNFTPVPEPSTYALLALGLGFVLWQVRRRRQG